MSIIKVILSLLVVVLFLLFIAQNAGYVDISLFYTVYKVPLFVLLLISFALGFIIPSLYFIFKEAILRKRLKDLENALEAYSKGHMNRAERFLIGVVKHIKGAKALLGEVLIRQGRVDEVSKVDLVIFSKKLLKEGKFKEAEEGFKEVLIEDSENVEALKGLRDAYALQNKWKESLECQERILDICERWEKEVQKRIKAEILAKLYLEEGNEKYIEKAFDLYATPFVYATYIKYLLLKDRIRDVKKLWEKLFSLNYQEDVLWNLMEDEKTLSKILDLIELKKESIHPDTLLLVYIKLNLLSKAKELEDTLSFPAKALLYSALSHRDQDKFCLTSIKDLLKPLVCSCGKDYNSYHLLCSVCFNWGEIKIRRV